MHVFDNIDCESFDDYDKRTLCKFSYGNLIQSMDWITHMSEWFTNRSEIPSHSCKCCKHNVNQAHLHVAE